MNGNVEKKNRFFTKNSKNKQKSSIASKKTISQGPLRIGQVLELTINAVGSKGIGISQLPSGSSVLVPNAHLGDLVKVEIVKVPKEISSNPSTPAARLLKKSKYAVGKIVQVLRKAELQLPVTVGEKLTLAVTTKGPRGSALIELPNNYTLIIPKTNSLYSNDLLAVGNKINIEITRTKSNYAFAKLVNADLVGPDTTTTSENSRTGLSSNLLLDRSMAWSQDFVNKIQEGSKFNLIIPKTAKTYANHAVVKVNGFILFIKLGLGTKVDDKIQIKINKIYSNFGIAKIIKRSPISKVKKQLKIQQNVKLMLQNGMHYGENAIKCHAKMKGFIWQRKKGTQKNKPLVRKGRHLINLLKTRRCLNTALQQLGKYAAKGKTFLFVGTKKPAAGLIARTALLAKTSFFVNTRWLGGMLTNWKTIRKSISKVRPILQEKQRIIQTILQKRERIKMRLIRKMNLLRSQSRLLVQKGKTLIITMKKDKEKFLEINQKLLKKRQYFILKGQVLIDNYKQLSSKRKETLEKTLLLQEKCNDLIKRKKNLIKQFTNTRKKLRELQFLLLLSKEMNKLKTTALNEGKNVYTISYGKSIVLTKQNGVSSENNISIVPNPPKEILNKILSTMKKRYENNSLSVGNFGSNRPKQEQTKSKVILLSKLLNKFGEFLPFIRNSIMIFKARLQNIQALLQNMTENITSIKTHIQTSIQMKENLVLKQNLIKTRLISEQNTIELLKTQLKQLASEQRLLRFLPKLKSLSKPQTRISNTIQVLMKKFVDPKMKYPMDKIYDEKLKSTSKKIAASRKKKWQRLEKYFGGVAKMSKMTNKQMSNKVAIIVGQVEEMNAVRECKKLGIKMFHIVDTNCNPQLADYFIPANDDSRKSIKFILEKMLKRIRLGQQIRQIYLKKLKKQSSLQKK